SRFARGYGQYVNDGKNVVERGLAYDKDRARLSLLRANNRIEVTGLHLTPGRATRSVCSCVIRAHIGVPTGGAVRHKPNQLPFGLSEPGQNASRHDPVPASLARLTCRSSMIPR